MDAEELLRRARAYSFGGDAADAFAFVNRGRAFDPHGVVICGSSCHEVAASGSICTLPAGHPGRDPLTHVVTPAQPWHGVDQERGRRRALFSFVLQLHGRGLARS